MGIELLLTAPNSSCNWNASSETSTELALGVEELGEETAEPLELLGPEHELELGLEYLGPEHELEPGLDEVEEDSLAPLGDLKGVETTVLSASRA